MWTTANRPKYNRDKLRYPSDLTDSEWGHVEPLIPPAKHGGRKAQGRCARGREWDHVRIEHGLPMALCSQGPAAQEHALRLFRSVDLRRHVGEYPSRALCEVSRANRARGQPYRLRHR